MMSFGVNWLPVGLQAHTVFVGFMFTAMLVKPVGVGVQIQDFESAQYKNASIISRAYMFNLKRTLTYMYNA